MKKGSILLIAGELSVQLCGFLRNLIVARALEPSDFGVAASIAMAATFIEVIAGLDVGRFLTRKHDDNIQEWLGIAHLISILRGVFTGLVLFASGGILAEFMRMSDYEWAFRLMGFIPLIRAFNHQFVWAEQRKMNFTPFVLSQAAPQIITLVMVIPVLMFFKDYRALLVLSFCNAVTYTLMSHLVAKVKYTLSVSKPHFRELWKYSLPLWLDGLLMFWVLQGERIIIGREFGAAWVGIYSVAFLLIWTPAAITSRFGQSIGVPYFSSLQAKGTSIEKDYRVMLAIVGALSIGFVLTLVLGGSSMLVLFFGEQYSAPSLFVGLLGLHYGIRIMRVPPTVLFLSSGETKWIAKANAIRASGVICAWLLAIKYQSIEVVFAVSVVAEFLAAEVLYFNASKYSQATGLYRYIVYALMTAFVVITATAYFVELLSGLSSWQSAGLGVLTGIILIVSVFLISMRFYVNAWGDIVKLVSR